LGFEAAENELDTAFSLWTADGQGGLRPVDVFNPDSLASELRYEIFASHFLNGGALWSLEGEMSRKRVRGFDPNGEIVRREQLDEREVRNFVLSIQANF